MGGIIERGAYLKFWPREERVIREGGLTEKGLIRASTVLQNSTDDDQNKFSLCLKLLIN